MGGLLRLVQLLAQGSRQIAGHSGQSRAVISLAVPQVLFGPGSLPGLLQQLLDLRQRL